MLISYGSEKDFEKGEWFSNKAVLSFAFDDARLEKVPREMVVTTAMAKTVRKD